MFFSYVKSVGCNRFSLNGKRTIIIRPTTKTQVLLGTNGSGKSSLLAIAFSPLPPDPEDFEVNGVRDGELHQIVHHKGHTYELHCVFAEKNSYSFIVDGGENLNKGRTVTIQLELVRQHFGYTRELHKFITGEDGFNFTQMGAQTRRDWIAKFSPSDFGFAFKKYNEWKKAASAAGSIVAHIRSRIAEVKETLLDDEVTQEMQAKSRELQETLELLLREPKFEGQLVTDVDVGYKVEELVAKYEAFQLTEYPELYDQTNKEDLIKFYDGMNENISEIRGAIKEAAEELSKVEHRRERILKLQAIDPVQLENEIKEIETKLSEIPPIIVDIPDFMIIHAQRPIQELRMAVGKLPTVRKTGEEVMQLNNVVMEKKLKLGRVGSLLDDLNRQIVHIQKCESVTCPSCTTVFKPGIDPNELVDLETRVAKGLELKKDLDSDLADEVSILDEAARSAEAYQTIENIRNTYQAQYPGLFLWLSKNGWLTLGRQLSEKIAIYERDVVYVENKDKLMIALQERKHALESFRSTSSEANTVMQAHSEAVAKYDRLRFKMETAVMISNKVGRILQSHHDYERMFEEASKSYEQLKQTLLDYCNGYGTMIIEDMIKKTKISIGIHEVALTENEHNQTIIKDLQVQLDKALVQETAYSILRDELSPKDGLIAQQIASQLNIVINGVNKIIGGIWGYPLYIEPGTADDKEMDYKFPLTVDTTPRKDIAKGSSSIKDVINQSFRLTGYGCMNLTDYPLFLDEFGRTFDEAHRHKLIPVVKDITDDPRFSQVFLISHSLDGQVMFPGSQTIILDDRNIKYPGIYNQHVEFA